MELSNKEALKINIDNYSGPLDVLLDLAKAQKVDLTNISITQLADQFIEFINSAKEINLDLASEYLLMATWLAYLKSKLLLPEDDDDDPVGDLGDHSTYNNGSQSRRTFFPTKVATRQIQPSPTQAAGPEWHRNA